MRLSVRLREIVPAALLALAASGCGGAEHDAMEKQLGELRAEVVRLRASQAALSERLDAVEIERGTFGKGGASSSATPPAPPADRDRPDLDVVRLAPSEGEGDADTTDGGSRPVIRATGSGSGETRPSKGAARSAPKKGVASSSPGSKKTQDSDTRPVVKP